MKLSGFVDVSEVTYSWPHIQLYCLVIFTLTPHPLTHSVRSQNQEVNLAQMPKLDWTNSECQLEMSSWRE